MDDRKQGLRRIFGSRAESTGKAPPDASELTARRLSRPPSRPEVEAPRRRRRRVQFFGLITR